MTSYHILPATIADVSALVQLVNSAYRGEGSKKGWTTEADLLDGVRTSIAGMQAMLNEANATILKAVAADGIFHGCVYLRREPTHLYLGMLTVAPQLQGAGLGKKLMAAAEAYAHTHTLKAIQMSVIAVRQELIDWYKRHGYTETGERIPFPTDPAFGLPKQPLEFLVLRKQLL